MAQEFLSWKIYRKTYQNWCFDGKPQVIPTWRCPPVITCASLVVISAITHNVVKTPCHPNHPWLGFCFFTTYQNGDDCRMVRLWHCFSMFFLHVFLTISPVQRGLHFLGKILKPESLIFHQNFMRKSMVSFKADALNNFLGKSMEHPYRFRWRYRSLKQSIFGRRP